jgi:beta-N-acetylhexosaminidase
MGFTGVLITDDMNMGAITNYDWPDHPAVMSIMAGADMILDVFDDFSATPTNKEERYPESIAEQIERIAEAVLDGRIDPEQIDQSIRRILRLKMKYCLFEKPQVDLGQISSRVNTPQNIATSEKIHEQAMTLVRNDQGLWPLDPESDDAIFVVSPSPIISQDPAAGWPNIATTSLRAQIKALVPSATGILYDTFPSNRVINRIVNRVEQTDIDTLIIGSYNAQFDTQQQLLIQKLYDLGLPTVLVVLAMPYDLMVFPQAQTVLNSYSSRNIALKVVSKTLFGFNNPTGRLPVSIPGFYGIGHSAFLP